MCNEPYTQLVRQKKILYHTIFAFNFPVFNDAIENPQTVKRIIFGTSLKNQFT